MSYQKDREDFKNYLMGATDDDQVCEDIVDMLNCIALSKIANSTYSYLYGYDLERIYAIKDTPDLVMDDPADLIVMMAYKAREHSHGAASLAKVFMSKSMYKSMTERIGIDANALCKISNVPVYSSEAIKDSTIYGLCKNKFKYMPSKDLVWVGRVPNFKE